MDTAVHIHYISNTFESVKRYPDRKYNSGPLYIRTKKCIDIIDKKITVFKVKEQTQIHGQGKNEELPFSGFTFGLMHRFYKIEV